MHKLLIDWFQIVDKAFTVIRKKFNARLLGCDAIIFYFRIFVLFSFKNLFDHDGNWGKENLLQWKPLNVITDNIIIWLMWSN